VVVEEVKVTLVVVVQVVFYQALQHYIQVLLM
jgi:hypothetical protein